MNAFQGTVAVELMEQVEHLDAVLVPVGGGGLVSGIATWVNYINPKCRGMSHLSVNIYICNYSILCRTIR